MFHSKKVQDSEDQQDIKKVQCAIEMTSSKSSLHSKSSSRSSSTKEEHVCHDGCIHAVAKTECNCNLCLEHSERCMKCSLATDDGLHINSQDVDGNTPLHITLLYQNLGTANLLVRHGADVYIRNNRGDDPLRIMAKSCPEVMVAVLNRAVSVEKYFPNNAKCVLRLDFGTVVGTGEECGKRKGLGNVSHLKKELCLLSAVLGTSKYSRQTILTHPLVVIFLDQKWKRVKKYFVVFFFCYLFWLLSYTSYIIKVYLVSCPCDLFSKPPTQKVGAGDISEPNGAGRKVGASEDRCHLETGLNLDSIIVLLLTLIMAVNEIVKIITIPRLYLRSRINIGNWILILMVIITTGPIIMEKDSKLESWQFQAAALGTFLSWAFILAQLGTIPSLGRYVEILGHVLRNFGFSMLTFSSLFIAFALSFNVLFPGSEPFSHFFFAILKVLVMMAGEVDYQDMFYDKENDATTGPIMGHILYAAFVIIVSIVLMNLLIGLTVSDIQLLEKEAELTRVFRQISEMLTLESALFSGRLGRHLGPLIQRSISVTGHKKRANSKERFSQDSDSKPFIDDLVFRIRPNDRSDKSVPEDLKAAALQIASKNFNSGGSGCQFSTSGHSAKSVHFEQLNISA